MAWRSDDFRPYLIVEAHQRLVAVPSERDGREVTYYFVEEERSPDAPLLPALREALIASGDWDEATVDAAFADLDRSTRDAFEVIGSLADLDWDEVERELDRTRHENPPTPPIEL